jgi:hypothetical protein
LGEHHIPVRLSADHHPEFLVVVQQEGAPAAPAAAPAAVEPQLVVEEVEEFAEELEA